MVIDSVSVQKRISNNERLCSCEDKGNILMRLRLEEDDHFLMMKEGEKIIAKWNATRVTLDEIRDTANSYAENNHSALEFRLCHFWKQHPQAKFSLDSIAGSVGTTKTNIRNRIGLLIEKGILREQLNGQSTIVYSLNNGNEVTQEYIQQADKLCTNRTEIIGCQLAKEAVLV